VSVANAEDLGGGRGRPEGPGAHYTLSLMMVLARINSYPPFGSSSSFQIHLYSRFRFMRHNQRKIKHKFTCV
jgi:hypothetical protein